MPCRKPGSGVDLGDPQACARSRLLRPERLVERGLDPVEERAPLRQLVADRHARFVEHGREERGSGPAFRPIGRIECDADQCRREVGSRQERRP